MQFSRLDDTEFPNLETASPYALKNTFDYTRWVPGTKVRLVNVLWDANYENVVKFDSDAQRDAWFDGISDAYDLTLTANARMVPDGTIKLPLPYDVAARYNYLVVEIPLATSREALIQNETTLGARRWHFFVGDISYSAPNTTVVSLASDVWTNFINQSDIAYMMLARGHAPVASSDTDTFLANPIANNRYLLAPDVNYDDSSVVRDSKYVPFGNGEKWVCLASTTGYDGMAAGILGQMSADASFSGFTDPTFSDTSDWYGYQLQVNGFAYDAKAGYDNQRSHVDPYLAVAGNAPNGTCTFAVPGTDFGSFITDVTNRCPAFLRTIQACFVVDSAMLVVQSTVNDFCGHTVYVVYGATGNVGSYELSKSMFGFDENEQRFAKLYTYPYSRIEVSDNAGRSVEVRIENTGSIGIERFCSLAFPMLDCKVFLTGINGSGSTSYAWKTVSGGELSRSCDFGDWDELSFHLGIPTFSLYMQADTAYILDNYSKMQNGRDQALARYHASVRSANGAYTNGVASANTGYQNAVDSANTANTNSLASANTANTNSLASANTGQQNAVASANTANTNANASASTTNTNALASANTGQQNAVAASSTAHTNANASAATGQTISNNSAVCARNNINLTISANTANTDRAVLAANRITGFGATNARVVTNETNGVSYTTTSENNETSISTTKTSGAASVATGAINGAQTGAAIPAPTFSGGLLNLVTGAVLGGVTASIDASVANSNASLVANTATSLTALNNAANNDIRAANTTLAADTMTEENNAKSDQNTNNNNCLAGQRDNNYNTSTTNATNLYNMQTANATRTDDTAQNNANRTLATSTNNANRTLATSQNNANRTLSTETNNANRTLATSQNNANRTLATDTSNANRTLSTATGNATRTQSTSIDNATRSREVSVLNAQETLRASQDNSKSAVSDAMRGAPIRLTESNADADFWLGQKGIQFRLRTQSDSAIAQTAAQFARYGYALNQLWDVGSTGLKLMSNFTYWQASDVWVDVRNVASSQVGNDIARIFRDGVTVWNDPTKIGKVGIYDN